MKFCKYQKAILFLTVASAACFALPATANAMHIMEGYLPIVHCIAWIVISLPFLYTGVVRLRQVVKEKRRTLMLLAMSGAFIFVISSLKIPSVTGSSSHMTGTGLSAILFGVSITSILTVIVLLFQAILLAHGGITTLGANVFAMGIAGPLVTMLLYKAGKKMKVNRMVNIFIAAAIGSLCTYIVTALQLAFAYPGEVGGVMSSAVKFLGVFAPTQIPLAVVEALLTLLVIMGLESLASRELSDISYGGELG